jgi:hypothetical protein
MTIPQYSKFLTHLLNPIEFNPKSLNFGSTMPKLLITLNCNTSDDISNIYNFFKHIFTVGCIC